MSSFAEKYRYRVRTATPALAAISSTVTSLTGRSANSSKAESSIARAIVSRCWLAKLAASRGTSRCPTRGAFLAGSATSAKIDTGCWGRPVCLGRVSGDVPDEVLEVADVAALEQSVDMEGEVVDDRVSLVPLPARLGVEPVEPSRTAPDLSGDLRPAPLPVRPGVAEDDDRRAFADLVPPRPPE